MGVTGLWKLIDPCGKPVPVETLEGKILAVDISIWLHQVVKGYQDNKGSVLPQAHLLGLFHRLCKLLYYRIRPIFVFDGAVPQLKLETIARRQQQRNKLNNETERIQTLLLQSLAKEKVVQQALGVSVEMLLKSPSKRSSINVKSSENNDDLYKLPLSANTSTSLNEENECRVREEEEQAVSFVSDDLPGTSFSTNDSSFGESNLWKTYNTNLQAIDVRSQEFRNLPPEVRHEILIDIKETRKQSSWGRLHKLPPRSGDFSSFQMKRLLKRRAVQESLEETEKEMEDPTLNYNELKEYFTEEGILQPTDIKLDSKQIFSDEYARFLLVNNLKKNQCNFEKEKLLKGLSNLNESDKNSTEIWIPKLGVNFSKEKSQSKQNLDIDNTDLQVALARSLQDGSSHVYCKEDYEYDSNECLKLNNEQRNNLQNAAKGPARAYMIEYGGMNDTEVIEILQKTQPTPDTRNTYTDFSTMGKRQKHSSAKSVSTGENMTEMKTNSPAKSPKVNDDSDIKTDSSTKGSQEICLKVSDDSETDSSFEDISESEAILDTEVNKKKIEIVLNTEKILVLENDLFADVFDISEENKGKSIHSNDFLNVPKNSEIVLEKSLVLEDFKEACELKDTSFNNMNIVTAVTERIKEKTENLLQKKERPLNKYLQTETATNQKFNEYALNRQFKNKNMQFLLDELKNQAERLDNIKLDSIKLPSNIPTIEISDDEKTSETILTEKLNEVVEIYDGDDKKIIETAVTKSPSAKTNINDYFKTKYFVKRTPNKRNEEEILTANVKSPFFVEKSPSSSRKRSVNDNNSSPCRVIKLRKASKSLFHEVNKSSDVEASNEGEIVIEATQTSTTSKNSEKLQKLAADLAKERSSLEVERNRQDRMSMPINQRMNSDCQRLLRIFGIPYIVAPMEAEAQCAYLDAVELTNGTITDDSDIWLFGGQTVYKNFFEQNKHVLEFKAARIEHLFNCDRKKLIQLACLVGSDYTNGVHGIGAVTALEILASFSTLEDLNEKISNSATTAVLSTLCRFRDWWKVQKTVADTSRNSTRLNLRKKLKNIQLNKEFPNPAVIEAYLNPKIDDNKEAFSWGHIDVESLYEFTKKTFGWTTKKTDDILTPVLKRLNQKETQTSICNYFTTKGIVNMRQIKVSKRVQKAIDTMSSKPANVREEKSEVRPRKKRSKKDAKALRNVHQ